MVFVCFVWFFFVFIFFFFFNDTATTEIYTLSLHDALPISRRSSIVRSDSASPRSSTCGRSVCRRENASRSEEHTSELQSHSDLVCRLLLEKKKDEDLPPVHDDNKREGDGGG